MKLFHSGELYRRSRQALRSLANCKLCPRDCEVDRLNNEQSVFQTERRAWVGSYAPHHGEEDCLRGSNGSGTIFFSLCNLKCVFCQNWEISQDGEGIEVSPEDLAAMMLDLQNRGCHNINFVTPEHVVPQILEALPLAVQMGLRLPLVYNTGAYDSMEIMQMIEDIINIYMPDFKYWNNERSKKYLKAKDYPEAARAVIQEMHRQVGDLVLDENGLAKRGVPLRHLVMLDGLEETKNIMEFLVKEVSTDTYVNIMGQYFPSGKVSKKNYQEINRRPHSQELVLAEKIARQKDLHRFSHS
jgi:putative pyruvate formate lyase activating enzyme